MAWRIDVAPQAHEFFRIVEATLREELIARIAEIADAPLPELRRSRPPREPTDAWVYEYLSEVVSGLRVMAIFGEVDASAKRMVLVAVTDEMDQEPEGN